MIKLLLFLGIQALFLYLLLHYKKHFSNTKTSLLAAVFLYISIIIMVVITNYILKSELDAHDLNGDGIFSGNEINEDQKKAMKAIISDTGRTLAPFTGILFSALYFTLLKVTLHIFRRKKMPA